MAKKTKTVCYSLPIGIAERIEQLAAAAHQDKSKIAAIFLLQSQTEEGTKIALNSLYGSLLMKEGE